DFPNDRLGDVVLKGKSSFLFLLCCLKWLDHNMGVSWVNHEIEMFMFDWVGVLLMLKLHFISESSIITGKTQDEAQADGSAATNGSIPVFCSCNAGLATYDSDIENFVLIQFWKTPLTDAIAQGAESNKEMQINQLHFGLNKMKNYYVQYKEKWSITAEARFEVDSFKDDFPDIYDQFQILY
ncbi:hypothetical protein HAX54_047005, partial [Datura stramonium]|nr:hypothetical protein [Datura stramonium]